MRKLYGPEISGPGILNYHSSREERYKYTRNTQALACPAPARPRGFFARFFGNSRASKFTFINIIAMVIVLALYTFLSSGVSSGTWSREGFRFALSAYSHENKVFTSVRVTKEKGGEWKGSAPEITLESGMEKESFTPALPLDKGETQYVRTVFSMPESGKISGLIRFAGKTKQLTVDVKKD